jgi:hypothetical protein
MTLNLEKIRFASDVNEISNQEDLINIAYNHGFSDVRREAVLKITDDEVLMDIFKKDRDTRVVRAAVEAVRDNDFLLDIALNFPEKNMRFIAIDNLYKNSSLDLNSLFEHIALNDPDASLRSYAVNLFENHDLLLQIAKSDDVGPSKKAIQRITDEKTLAEIGLFNPHYNVRKSAILNPHLTSFDVLCKIIKIDVNQFNRYDAISKIDDEDLPHFIFNKSLNHRLNDFRHRLSSFQDYFRDILINSEDDYQREVAAYFIDDEDTLEAIVLSEPCDNVRISAIRNYNFHNQKLLKELFYSESNPDMTDTIVSKIIDNEVLIEYVEGRFEKQSSFHEDAVFNALGNISDRDFLKNLALNHDDLKIRVESVRSISEIASSTDAIWNLLRDIAVKSTDIKVSIEAIQSIKSQRSRNFGLGASNDYMMFIADNCIIKEHRKYCLERITTFEHAFNLDREEYQNQYNYRTARYLAEIALNDDDAEIRKTVAKRVDAVSVLDEIIRNDSNQDVVDAAKKRLHELASAINTIDDEKTLTRMLEACNNDYVANVIRKKLDGLKTLDSRLRNFRNIRDIETLKDMASNETDYFLKCSAEDELIKLLFETIPLNEVDDDENQMKFKDIAMDKGFSVKIREEALLNINDDEFLAGISDDLETELLKAIVGKLKDKSVLKNLALNHPSYRVRLDAIRNRHTGGDVLEYVSINEPVSEIRYECCLRINNENILHYILKNDLKKDVRLASEWKLRLMDIKEKV